MTENQPKGNVSLAGKYVMVDELGNLTSDGTQNEAVLEILRNIAEQGRLAGRFIR